MTLNVNDPRFTDTDYILKWNPGNYPQQQFCWLNKNLPNSCDSDTTKISESVIKTLQIYPNPSMGLIQIRLPENTPFKGTLAVYDYTGKQILSQAIPYIQQPNMVYINIENQPSGIYLLRLQIEGAEYSGKVLLIK